MIVGNGLVAKTFVKYKNDPRVIIFASGVSNSNEVNNNCFKREEKLLRETIKSYKTRAIVYFSSCDVIYAENIGKPYYYHKLSMEALVKASANNYFIFRLPQIIGKSTNKYSLINYFVQSMLSEKEINIWKDAYKNLIDIEDAYKIIDYLIENNILNNKTTNIINNNYYSMRKIISTLEDVLGIKASVKQIHKGYKPDYFMSAPTLVNFNSDYLNRSLSKYYKK